jgi:hypothetical protein
LAVLSAVCAREVDESDIRWSSVGRHAMLLLISIRETKTNQIPVLA